MAFADFLEGLTGTVTRMWRRAEPEESTPTTEVPQPDEDGWGQYPFGEPSPMVKAYERRVDLINSREAKYALYEEMDRESPAFSSALDIYADNATRGDQDGNKALTIKSANPEVARELEKVRRELGLDEILWSIVRDVAKYGERAEEVIVGKNYRIQRLKPLPTLYIIPQKDEYGMPKDPPYVQISETDRSKEVASFQEWQILYFANRKSRNDLHGEGLGNPIRRSFLQLRMMEDAVVIARLTRAHNRLAYYVDTGKMPKNEAQRYLEGVKSALHKRRVVDPRTGKMNLNWSPLSVEEDIFIATNKESKADVKTLQGDLTIGNLADLEYFQQNLFTGLKTPKAYLGHEKDVRSKGVITHADMQFARSVRRIQHVVETEIGKVFDLALTLRGFTPVEGMYEVRLPRISIIDELRVWQTNQLKALVARMWKQTFWPSDEWILSELLGYPSDQVQKLLSGQKKPDPFSGLHKAAGVGNVPMNVKTKDEAISRLSELPEEELSEIEQAVDNLHLLMQW